MSTPHLVGAVRNFLLAQGSLTTQLTGGVADGQASRDTPLPYLVLELKDSHSLRVFGGGEVYWATVWFTTFAPGRAQAEAIGNAVRDLILPPDGAPPWQPLTIDGGWNDTNRQPAGGDAIEIDPETRAALGVDVWACRRPVSWTISR